MPLSHGFGDPGALGLAEAAPEDGEGSVALAAEGPLHGVGVHADAAGFDFDHAGAEACQGADDVTLAAWLLAAGSCVFRQHAVEHYFRSADGLVWGEGTQAVTVGVEESTEGELSVYRIAFVAADGSILARRTLTVDGDMWGGGFVRSLQADTDRERELVAWGHYEFEESFTADFVDGKVSFLPFRESPVAVRDVARQWHDARIMTPAAVLMALLPLAVWYVVAAAVIFAVRAIRRRS